MGLKGTSLMCSETKDKFLAALREGNTVEKAANLAGYAYPTQLYAERRRDEEFAAAWEEAAEIKTLLVREMAEDELARRGMDGWEEETWTRDPATGRMRVQKRVRQKDTRALLSFLGANWREKYGTVKQSDERPQIVVEVDRFAIELQPLAARLLGGQPGIVESAQAFSLPRGAGSDSDAD